MLPPMGAVIRNSKTGEETARRRLTAVKLADAIMAEARQNLKTLEAGTQGLALRRCNGVGSSEDYSIIPEMARRAGWRL